MKQVKKIAHFNHSDVFLFDVCPACDKHMIQATDRVCQNPFCNAPIKRIGRRRQMAFIDIVAKVKRMYANADIAEHMTYAATRKPGEYPGDIYDINEKMQNLTAVEKNTKRSITMSTPMSAFTSSMLYATIVTDLWYQRWIRVKCLTKQNIHRLC